MNKIRILPDGKEEDVLHSLGFSYTGSGKELSNSICKAGKSIILIIEDTGKGKVSILRAEPFSKAVVKHIKKILKESHNKKDISDSAKPR